MACMEIMLLVLTFFCFCASVSYTEITNLEQRLTHMEQVIEERLNTTERILGQFLTGRNDANLAALDVLSLRTGILDAQPEPVIFSAYKRSSESGISTKVTIRFEQTYINIGSHYHTENGIFIAPTTGVYMFHWTIVSGSTDFSTQLMVEGNPMASSYVPYPGGADSSSAMAIIRVNKDAHVWIQIYGSSEYVYGGSNSIGNNYQSTFSGILLKS